MQVAVDFIDESRLLLDDSTKENFNSRYTDPELFVYLQNAYVILQSDAPQFIASKSIPTQKDETVYHVDDQILDGIKLFIQGDEFVKTSITKLQDLMDVEEDYYATNLNEIFLNKQPKEDQTIRFTYYKTKVLKSLDSGIEMPVYYHEALRLLFFSRAFEKMPAKNDRDLSIHYYKRYEREMFRVKNRTRQKYRGLTSNHQKI